MGTTESPDGALMVQWFFGGLVVVFYAIHRFNEPRQDPRPARSTTTFWRYWSACGGYVAAMLALFIVLGGGIGAIDPRILMPLIDAEPVPADVRALPGPLLSALVLTSLLPHFPGLGKIDASVKRWFQDVGNIPWEVRELSRFLRDSAYAPGPEALAQVRGVLRSLDVEEAWLREPADTIKHRWARSVALYGHVRRWEASHAFGRYVDQHRTALPEIRERIDKLAEFLDARTLDELDGGRDSRLVAHSRKVFDSELSSLQDSLCNFVSGGVLEGARNHARRRDALAQLGFAGLPATRGPLTSHDVVLVAGLVFLAMLFVPLMLRRFIDPLPMTQNLRILVTVPIVYAIAIGRRHLSEVGLAVRRPPARRRAPFAAYAVSGVIAAAASFASRWCSASSSTSPATSSSRCRRRRLRGGVEDDAGPLALAPDDLLRHRRGRLDRRQPGAGRPGRAAAPACHRGGSLAIASRPGAVERLRAPGRRLAGGGRPARRGGAAHRRHRDRRRRLHRLAGADDAPHAQPGAPEPAPVPALAMPG